MTFNNKLFLLEPKFNGTWWLAKTCELVEWDIETDTKYITNVKEIDETTYYNMKYNEGVEDLPRQHYNLVTI